MTKRNLSRLSILAIVAALVPAGAAVAQSFSTGSAESRADRWEFYGGARLVQSGSADFAGGSNIKTQDDLGFDFGFGYNVSDHLLVNGELAWNTISYDGNLISADIPAANPQRISGDLDVASIGASVTWNFLTGPITPYASAMLGWTWVDTNIATGPPDIGCWWDPWWGQICAPIANTIHDDSASYGLGIGVRWDFARGMFARFGYDERWIDIKNASGTPDFGAFRLDVGSKF